MTKEEAVERIMDYINETYPVLDQQKLTAILTELMEPIGVDQIYIAAKSQKPIGNSGEVTSYRNGYYDGMKAAATRNLKVSLEGLMVYEANREGDLWEVCQLKDLSDEDKKDEFREYCLKLSDVEKLVG